MSLTRGTVLWISRESPSDRVLALCHLNGWILRCETTVFARSTTFALQSCRPTSVAVVLRDSGVDSAAEAIRRYDARVKVLYYPGTFFDPRFTTLYTDARMTLVRSDEALVEAVASALGCEVAQTCISARIAHMDLIPAPNLVPVPCTTTVTTAVAPTLLLPSCAGGGVAPCAAVGSVPGSLITRLHAGCSAALCAFPPPQTRIGCAHVGSACSLPFAVAGICAAYPLWPCPLAVAPAVVSTVTTTSLDGSLQLRSFTAATPAVRHCQLVGCAQVGVCLCAPAPLALPVPMPHYSLWKQARGELCASAAIVAAPAPVLLPHASCCALPCCGCAPLLPHAALCPYIVPLPSGTPACTCEGGPASAAQGPAAASAPAPSQTQAPQQGSAQQDVSAASEAAARPASPCACSCSCRHPVPASGQAASASSAAAAAAPAAAAPAAAAPAAAAPAAAAPAAAAAAWPPSAPSSRGASPQPVASPRAPAASAAPADEVGSAAGAASPALEARQGYLPPSRGHSPVLEAGAGAGAGTPSRPASPPSLPVAAAQPSRSGSPAAVVMDEADKRGLNSPVGSVAQQQQQQQPAAPAPIPAPASEAAAPVPCSIRAPTTAGPSPAYRCARPGCVSAASLGLTATGARDRLLRREGDYSIEDQREDTLDTQRTRLRAACLHSLQASACARTHAAAQAAIQAAQEAAEGRARRVAAVHAVAHAPVDPHCVRVPRDLHDFLLAGAAPAPAHCATHHHPCGPRLASPAAGAIVTVSVRCSHPAPEPACPAPSASSFSSSSSTASSRPGSRAFAVPSGPLPTPLEARRLPWAAYAQTEEEQRRCRLAQAQRVAEALEPAYALDSGDVDDAAAVKAASDYAFSLAHGLPEAVWFSDCPTDPLEPLSNASAAFPFELDGRVYPSVDHYLLATVFREAGMDDVALRIEAIRAVSVAHHMAALYMHCVPPQQDHARAAARPVPASAGALAAAESAQPLVRDTGASGGLPPGLSAGEVRQALKAVVSAPSREVPGGTRSGWVVPRMRLQMVRAVRAKVLSHPRLTALLISTGTAPLMWREVRSHDHQAARANAQLARLLGSLREQLQNRLVLGGA